MASQSEVSSPQRRDARRNRQLILDAARRLMAQEGLVIGHAQIAQAAGVGVGTVYRHFPDRELLIDALFSDHIADVVSYAEHATTADSAWDGLCGFMNNHLTLQEANRGLRELIRHAHAHPVMSGTAATRISPIISELLSGAQRDGDIGEDVTVSDIDLINYMVAATMESPRESDTGDWHRALDIALRGLSWQ